MLKWRNSKMEISELLNQYNDFKKRIDDLWRTL